MVYSTYLGGSDDELPHSLIVNSFDELYIMGTTSSNNFPTSNNCYDSSFNGGTATFMAGGLGVNYNNGSDIFISHLSSNGANLLGSTYIGGSNNDGLKADYYKNLLKIKSKLISEKIKKIKKYGKKNSS